MSDSDAYDQTDYTEDEYDARDTARYPTERGKWLSVVVALLGLWMLVQAAFLEPVAANYWSDVIVGLGLIALGGYNYYRRANERIGSVAVGAFVALLGLWLVVSPFLLGSGQEIAAGEELAMDAEFWNDVLVGLAVLALGAYSAYEARQTEAATPART